MNITNLRVQLVRQSLSYYNCILRRQHKHLRSASQQSLTRSSDKTQRKGRGAGQGDGARRDIFTMLLRPEC